MLSSKKTLNITYLTFLSWRVLGYLGWTKKHVIFAMYISSANGQARRNSLCSHWNALNAIITLTMFLQCSEFSFKSACMYIWAWERKNQDKFYIDRRWTDGQRLALLEPLSEPTSHHNKMFFHTINQWVNNINISKAKNTTFNFWSLGSIQLDKKCSYSRFHAVFTSLV